MIPVEAGQWRKFSEEKEKTQWRKILRRVGDGCWRVQYISGGIHSLRDSFVSQMTDVATRNPWGEPEATQGEIEPDSIWKWRWSETQRKVLMVTDTSVFYRQAHTDPNAAPSELEGRMDREKWLNLHVPTAPPGERWSVDHGEHQYVDWFGDILHISSAVPGAPVAIATSRAGGDEPIYVDIPLDELIEKLNEIRKGRLGG